MSDSLAYSKVLTELMYPTNVVLWLMVLALVFAIFKKVKTVCISLSLGLAIVLFGSSPLTSMLYSAHEQQYLPTKISESQVADAIVLLAGDVSIPVPPRVETQLRGNRVIHTMRLFRAGKAPMVIVTGGNVFKQENLKGEAEYTAELLHELGIPRDAIIVESSSRTTRENAIETEKVIRRHKLESVLLVTSAFHMPRALATFHSIGIDAIPSPSSISAKLARPGIIEWIPKLDGLGKLKSLFHEKLGILVYRVRDSIN